MASPLQIFTQAAAAKAFAIIGAETISISGGPSISGILNEAAHNRDYEEGGFEQSSTLDFVIDQTAFSASYPAAITSYEGNACVARGVTWRVAGIRSGQRTTGQFVIISLTSPNKSA